MSQHNMNQDEDLTWLHTQVAQVAHERVQQTERIRQQHEQRRQKMQRLADLKDRVDELTRVRAILANLGCVGVMVMSIGSGLLMAGLTGLQVVVTGAGITFGMGMLVLLCDFALWGARRRLAREEAA